MNENDWYPCKVNLSRWLLRRIHERTEDFSMFRRKKLTLQQFLELILKLATQEVLLADRPEFIKNFKPISKDAGRPRKSKLASPLSETVSKDQLHASKDEAGPGQPASRDEAPRDRPTPSDSHGPGYPW